MGEPPPAWADEMLRSARVGRLATADKAGRPLVVPVCYVWDAQLPIDTEIERLLAWL